MPQTQANLIHLSDRALLAITGPDARAFLQGMVTCNMDKLSQTQALYGAHLTHQGRMLDDFLAFEYQGKIVLDCLADRLMPLAKHLHSFQMRFEVEFEDLSDELAVFAAPTPHAMPLGTCALAGKGIAIADPRLSEMGTRHILPKQEIAHAAPVETYHAHRIALGVPEGVDFLRDKTIAGEFCLEYLNGVDYKKGCYIGQEMTARTHFRNAPKKRVVAITYNGPAPAFGAEVKAGNLAVGTLFSCHNGHGIAIVRIAKALAENANLSVDGKAISAQKPNWANYDIESES